MTIQDFKKYAKEYQPAVTIERYLGDFGNGFFSFIVFGITIVFGFISVFSLVAISLSNSSGALGSFAKSIVLDFSGYFPYIYGLFFLFFSVELFIRSIRPFHDSHAFSDLDVSKTDDNNDSVIVTYEVAPILLQPPNADPVLALIESPAGKVALYRLGLLERDIRSFVKRRVKPSHIGEVVISASGGKETDAGSLNFSKLSAAIIGADQDFSTFLSSRRIRPDDFIGVARWAEHIL